MPRVVLFSTDSDLTVEDLQSQTADWKGAPLELVWVSLTPVAGTTPVEPADGWAEVTSAGLVPGWSVTATAPPAVTAPATLSRKQAEALALEQGRELWAAVEDQNGIAVLVAGADALTAVDLGGVRTAYHLARRHDVAIATNGLVPCLVELDAIGGQDRPQSSEDSGGESESSRPL